MEIFTAFDSQKKKIKERLVRSINKLFLPSSDDKKQLHIWTTHRYDLSQEAAVAISSKSVDSSELEIKMPRPADWLQGMDKNNSPSAFCRVLGVRCGLIGPRGNRASIKRYLINSFTLETITLGALSKEDLEDGIELKELGEKLISAYNILIGADAETEYNLLAAYNIAQATPGDLRGDLSINSQAIANTYISLGMGKRYADGVTLIGWRL